MSAVGVGRGRRLHVVAALVALVVMASLASPAVGQEQQARLAGESRFDTAVAISQRAFPAEAQRVFLARADVFADALAAGSLTGGPVLLVPSCGELPASVVGEIARLNPAEVVALGGETAVCPPLLDAAAAGRQQSRLAGLDRFDTAVAISASQFPQGAATVFLARAVESPDAVAGGSLTGGPILLVPSSGPIPAGVLAEVARLAPQRVIALGGTAAVGDEVLAEAAGGRPTQRLAGADRFATAVAISQFQFPAAAGTAKVTGGQQAGAAQVAYLARAELFADAVAAGSLTDGPILLVPPCGEIPPVVIAGGGGGGGGGGWGGGVGGGWGAGPRRPPPPPPAAPPPPPPPHPPPPPPDGRSNADTDRYCVAGADADADAERDLVA